MLEDGSRCPGVCRGGDDACPQGGSRQRRLEVGVGKRRIRLSPKERGAALDANPGGNRPLRARTSRSGADCARGRATIDGSNPTAPIATATAAGPFPIYSPINGRVLRVLQESAAVVNAGTPLLELGDPSDLEVEIDVLSRDAVKIHPGDAGAVGALGRRAAAARPRPRWSSRPASPRSRRSASRSSA